MSPDTTPLILVRCPTCGQQHRVPVVSSGTPPLCRRCRKNPGSSRKEETPPPSAPLPLETSDEEDPVTISIWKVLAVCLVIYLVGWSLSGLMDVGLPPGGETGGQQSSGEQQHASRPLPENGEIRNFYRKERVAPLELGNTDVLHYCVKLADKYNGSTVLTVFVRRGETVTTTVPQGTYSLLYAAGETWYGYELLFGEDTVYGRVKEYLPFRRTSVQNSGHTVTLNRVPGGVQEMVRIEAGEF